MAVTGGLVMVEFDDKARVIDSNGQKYKVGRDEHGWFSIQMVEENPYNEGPDYVEATNEAGNPHPPVSFPPKGVRALQEAIEEY